MAAIVHIFEHFNMFSLWFQAEKTQTEKNKNILCYLIRDLILALLFVRGQSYWPEAEGFFSFILFSILLTYHICLSFH